jgi:hypothetical protein
MESPSTEVLVELLLKNKKSPEYIIEILVNILKQQMMYGGSVSDKLDYEIHRAKQDSYFLT